MTTTETIIFQARGKRTRSANDRDTARAVRLLALVLAALAVALALAGKAGAQSEPVVVDEPLGFVADGSLEPVSGGKSGFASIAAFGAHADFIPDQLILETRDEGALKAFLARWEGTVVDRFDPSESGLEGLAPQYVVQIDTRLADPDRLVEDLHALGVEARGTHRVSSEEGLRLLAAAAESAREGLSIGVNWIAQPATIRTRSTTEAPTSGGISSNAYSWPHICNGPTPACPQDLGVGEAWNLLARAGRLASQGATRVPIGILDGGYAPFDADTPPGSVQLISGANPFNSCGGGACPFHGSNVSDAATALPDNGFGAAGSGGPVARTIEFGYGGPVSLSTIVSMLGQVSGAGSVSATRILNMSFGIPAPAAVAWTLGVGDLVLGAVRASGKSLYAAAGNAGVDVDVVNSFLGIRWEADTVWPCEAPAVVCVGGLASGSKSAATGSNFGTGGLPGSGTVDVYGPFTVFVGPDGAVTGNVAQSVRGTSVASPFVAGVNALVMAANPALTPLQAESILLGTALATCSQSIPGTTISFAVRCVDAERAVRAALGNAPPDIRIVQPAIGTSHPRGKVRFRAVASDLEDGVPNVTWFLCGRQIGTGLDVYLDTYHCPFGAQTVTAVARDSFGWSVGDADGGVTFTLTNTPPSVSIAKPTYGATFYVYRNPLTGWSGDTILLEGTSSDPNNASGTLTDLEVRWLVGGRTLGGHRTSINALDLGIGTHMVTFTGDDGLAGASQTAMIEVKQWRPVYNPCGPFIC